MFTYAIHSKYSKVLTLLMLFGMLTTPVTLAMAQAITAPSSQPAAQRLHFSKAEISEHFNADGSWMPVARMVRLEGSQADQFGQLFPELQHPTKEQSTTFDYQRFRIVFTDTKGTRLSEIYINPRMAMWWNDRCVNELTPAAAAAITTLSKMATASRDIPNPAPVVRVEIVDREDGYGQLRRIPIKRVVTGVLAAMVANDFPEIGRKSEMQLADGGGYRFSITVHFANGVKHELRVIERVGENWIWYEDGNYWLLRPSGAVSLRSLCQSAKEDPTTTAPSLTPGSN